MKKVITICLSVVILLLCVIPAFAVADNSKLTYLYLDKGNITIGDGVVSGYGYFGEKVTAFDEDGYFITQTTSGSITNTINITGGENFVVFSNLNVYISNEFVCAVALSNDADLTLRLEGLNTFISGGSRGGVEVSVGTTLTVVGEGTLRAGSSGQAGIGGGNGNSSGTIIIESGTIIAQSKNNGAGIGGGSSGSNGKVIINGGNVSAYGGVSGSGIGGGCTGNGGEIIINGGTVTAVGGENAAGIGGGWYGSMGSIVIDGGSVKATGGTSAPAIGSGSGIQSGIVVNSEGEQLYLARFDASACQDFNDIYTDGKANNISSFHLNDTYFYFYLPVATHILAADSDSTVTSFWKATYDSSFTCSSVEPFEFLSSANIQPDDIIRGLSCGLISLEGYVNLSDGFEFTFTETFLGTGTQADLTYNGIPVFTYTILIYGDINGDSYYDGEDAFLASLILWGHLGSDNTQAIYLEAADIDRSGKIDSYDVETLQKAGVLLASVPQNVEGTVETDSAQWSEYISLIEQTVEENNDNLVTSIMDFITLFIDFIKSFIFSMVIV